MKALCLLMLAVVACAPAATPDSDQRTEPPATESHASPGPAAIPRTPSAPPVAASPSQRPEISIESVTAANPLLVQGFARTFENAVTVRLLDSNDVLITQRHVVSRGDSGSHNPYDAELWVVRDPGSRVTVEALEYSAKDGSVRSLVRRTLEFPTGRIRANLVFPTSDCTRFSTFTRELPRTASVARLLAEALIHGPAAEERQRGATTPFPQGSDLRSVILRNGVLTVDLNERLQNVGGSCAATAIRESLTRTLVQLPTVERVVITAAGSENLALQP